MERHDYILYFLHKLILRNLRVAVQGLEESVRETSAWALLGHGLSLLTCHNIPSYLCNSDIDLQRKRWLKARRWVWQFGADVSVINGHGQTKARGQASETVRGGISVLQGTDLPIKHISSPPKPNTVAYLGCEPLLFDPGKRTAQGQGQSNCGSDLHHELSRAFSNVRGLPHV